MGWISRLRASGEAEAVAPQDETVINGTPYTYQATRSNPINPVVRGALQDGGIAEEIKHRQTTLAVRYVAMVRACKPHRST
jgi:hypothetical protein